LDERIIFSRRYSFRKWLPFRVRASLA